MNCFIHPAKEASSVCKKCGKAMCINCSAYSNHSGICPACKKEEYEIEQSILINSLKQNKKSTIIRYILIAITAIISIIIMTTINIVIGAVLLVLPIIFGIKVLLLIKKRKPMIERIEFLTTEIFKLSKALSQGEKVI